MKYHLLFLTLLCLHFLAIQSKTLNEKKGFEITVGESKRFINFSPGDDVNGDGYSDLALAKETYSPDDGLAYVVYGGPTETLNNLNLANMTAKQGFTVKHSDPNTHVVSITLVDLNKDRFSDLVIAVNASSSYNYYVVFGGPSLSDIDLDTMKSAQGFRINGVEEKIGLYDPSRTRSAGDVNGDGYQDLMLQASSHMYLIYGGPSLSTFDVRNMTSKQGIKITFGKSVFYYCDDISSAGDINNDGYADLLISIKRHFSDVNELDSFVYVVYGGKSLNSLDITYMNSTQGFNITIGTFRSRQTKVNFAGDINKDGYADIIIGDPEYIKDYPNYIFAEAIYIVYGGKNLTSFDMKNMTESQGVKIVDNVIRGEYHYLGFSICSAGDFNKDGYADVLIGAPYKYAVSKEQGAAYIIYGGKSLSNLNVDKMNSQQGLAVTSPIKGKDNFGTQVKRLGDINKDGYDDVLIAFNEETRDIPVRKAYVLFGAPNNVTLIE